MNPYKLEFLSPTTGPAEWQAMWDALGRITGDVADSCPETGEAWQYMGSHNGQHQFRHRHRPATAQQVAGVDRGRAYRVYLDIDAQTLTLTRATSRPYPPPTDIPAALADSRAIGQRTEAGRQQNRIDARGAFGDFDDVSDADPGL